MKVTIFRDDAKLGEFDEDNIGAGLRSGRFRGSDQYICDGMADTRPLSDFRRTRPKISRRAALAVGLCVVGACAVGALRALSPNPPLGSSGGSSSSEFGDNEASSGSSARIQGEPRSEKPLPQRIFDSSSQSVVVIRALDAHGHPRGLGTGFFIGDGKSIATNFHVIEGATDIEIETLDGTVLTPSTILGHSIGRDVAILAVEQAGAPLLIESSPPSVGAKVFALGNPKGLNRTLSEGIISGLRGEAGEQFYQITASISPGSSGGPVISATGKVLGIATFHIVGGQNLNFALPASAIETALNATTAVPISTLPSIKLPKPAERRTDGVEIVSMEESPQRFDVTLRNNLSTPIHQLLLRVIYHRLPPPDQRPGHVIRQRDQAVSDIGSTTKALESLKLEVASIKGQIAELRLPLSQWTAQHLAKIPQRTDYEDRDTSTACGLVHIYAGNMVSWRKDRALKRGEGWASTQLEASIASFVAILEKRIAKHASTIREVVSKKAALELSLGTLRQRADNIAENEQTILDRYRSEITHYDDVVVDERIAPGLVKRVRVPRESEPDWGADIYILDHLTTQPEQANRRTR